MEIFIVVLVGVVTLLCYGMLNNCLKVMNNVKKKEKDE
tara:strand:+ start:13218 stop:13331 length:114 start_codon:yes stop_codon:yes gene_type:complete